MQSGWDNQFLFPIFAGFTKNHPLFLGLYPVTHYTIDGCPKDHEQILRLCEVQCSCSHCPGYGTLYLIILAPAIFDCLFCPDKNEIWQNQGWKSCCARRAHKLQHVVDEFKPEHLGLWKKITRVVVGWGLQLEKCHFLTFIEFLGDSAIECRHVMWPSSAALWIEQSWYGGYKVLICHITACCHWMPLNFALPLLHGWRLYHCRRPLWWYAWSVCPPLSGNLSLNFVDQWWKKTCLYCSLNHSRRIHIQYITHLTKTKTNYL
jgi:hypothetical protein